MDMEVDMTARRKARPTALTNVLGQSEVALAAESLPSNDNGSFPSSAHTQSIPHIPTAHLPKTSSGTQGMFVHSKPGGLANSTASGTTTGILKKSSLLRKSPHSAMSSGSGNAFATANTVTAFSSAMSMTKGPEDGSMEFVPESDDVPDSEIEEGGDTRQWIVPVEAHSHIIPSGIGSFRGLPVIIPSESDPELDGDVDCPGYNAVPPTRDGIGDKIYQTLHWENANSV